MARTTMVTNPNKEVKVLIVSCNAFVTDFLRDLIGAHGYETQEVSDFHEAQVQVENGWPHVVFIDDSCLEIRNINHIELKLQNWTQEGVSIILLGNEQTKLQVKRLSKMTSLQVMEKPVSYLQIGHLMADLTHT